MVINSEAVRDAGAHVSKASKPFRAHHSQRRCPKRCSKQCWGACQARPTWILRQRTKLEKKISIESIARYSKHDEFEVRLKYSIVIYLDNVWRQEFHIIRYLKNKGGSNIHTNHHNTCCCQGLQDSVTAATPQAQHAIKVVAFASIRSIRRIALRMLRFPVSITAQALWIEAFYTNTSSLGNVHIGWNTLHRTWVKSSTDWVAQHPYCRDAKNKTAKWW
jgi:hypothetical protein